MRFDAAKKLFLEHLKVVKQASPHTVRNYSIDLNCLQAFMKESKNRTAHEDEAVASVDKKTLRNFLAQQAILGQNRKTVVRRLSTLRSFFKYAYEHGIIPANPAEILETPKLEKKIPSPLTYAEVELLFALPDTTTYFGLRDRAIFELFYSSGLRISELVALNRSDIDFNTRLIRLKGKGKKERVIPFTKNASEWIKTYLDHPERCDSPAVFLNKWGKRLSARSIDRHFAAYLKRSGLAGRATPHTLRHTIATHWLENGMDLKMIQSLLGHSALAATTIYTKVSNPLKDKVYRESHPRAKKKKDGVGSQTVPVSQEHKNPDRDGLSTLPSLLACTT